MDEEDAGPSAATSSYFSTKNEVVEATITVPDLEQVGPEEHLELVGEILNILDNAVIIKGAQGGSDRALDADTLLVFEDRKVLGYVRHFDFVCYLNRSNDLSVDIRNVWTNNTTHVPGQIQLYNVPTGLGKSPYLTQCLPRPSAQ